jgi:YgiT-type zinc finger domain-containing protein
MRCVICHGEEVAIRDVCEELSVDNDIVRIPIRVPVCANCGERYYDRKTMRSLEHTRKTIRREKNHLKEVGKVLIYTT